jgi:hypothetical protein
MNKRQSEADRDGRETRRGTLVRCTHDNNQEHHRHNDVCDQRRRHWGSDAPLDTPSWHAYAGPFRAEAIKYITAFMPRSPGLSREERVRIGRRKLLPR